MIRVSTVALSLALLAPADCSSSVDVPSLVFSGLLQDAFSGAFEYEEAQYGFLPQREKSELRIVELYSRLHARSAQRGSEALKEFVSHRRNYPPEGGFLDMRLDEPSSREAEEEPNDSWSAMERSLRENLRVVASGLFLDENGELCAWRVNAITALDSVLTGANAMVSQAVLEDLAEDSLEAGPSFPWFDGASRSLARERAQAGGPWFLRIDGRLALDWPISQAGAARMFEEIARRDSESHFAGWFCSQIAELSCAENRAIVSFGSDDDPRVVFAPPPREAHEGPDQPLIDQIRAAGLPLGSQAAAEHIVGELIGRE